MVISQFFLTQLAEVFGGLDYRVSKTHAGVSKFRHECAHGERVRCDMFYVSSSIRIEKAGKEYMGKAFGVVDIGYLYGIFDLLLYCFLPVWHAAGKHHNDIQRVAFPAPRSDHDRSSQVQGFYEV